MQGMFSEEHEWGDISKSSPIGRKKEHREQFLFYLPKYWHSKNFLFSSAPFCNIMSPSKQRQQELETVWRNGLIYQWSIMTLQCPSPPVVVWGPSPPWSISEGLSTAPSWSPWHPAGVSNRSPHSAKEPLLKNLPYSDVQSSSFPGYLWTGQFTNPPTFNCFWTPSGICQWDGYWVLRPEARCGL